MLRHRGFALHRPARDLALVFLQEVRPFRAFDPEAVGGTEWQLADRLYL